MIRAPWFLKMLWSAAAPILPRATREKVKMLGGNFIDDIAAVAEGGSAQLPDFLGGGGGAGGICAAERVPRKPSTGWFS